MIKKTQRPNISEDEAFKEITSVQSAVDRVRFAAIGLGGSFSAAKKKSLLRQEKAAVARYGPTSPQAVTLHRRVESEERFAVAVQAEGQRAQVEPLQRNPKAMLMRGRVVDARRIGIAKLTVSAIGAKGKPAASAVTTDTGYYEFLVAADNQEVPATVSLLVSDSKKNILFRGCECFEVKAASVVTRELVLGAAEPIPQPTPPPIVDPRKVTVPDVRGLTRRDAEVQLNAFCLKSEVVNKETSPEKVGRVLDQKPAPGTTVRLADTLTLTVGIASATVEVPNVVKRSLEDAVKMLKRAELAVGKIQPRNASASNLVVKQIPTAREKVPRGTHVNLTVRRPDDGNATSVPLLIGLMQEEAISKLKENNLSVGKISLAASPKPKDVGHVLKQHPAASSLAQTGSAVNIKVGGPFDLVERVIERMLIAPNFKSIGGSKAKLVRRARENQLDSIERLTEFLAEEDRIVRDLLNLPNLRSARAFKELLKDSLAHE